MALTGFKNRTLIGKSDTTIPNFTEKVPQDNVSIFQFSKDPEQYLHPTTAIDNSTRQRLAEMQINTKYQVFTVRDKPVSAEKEVPIETPVLGV